MGGVIFISLVLLFVSHQSLILAEMTLNSVFVGIIFGGFLMSISFLTLIGFKNYDLNLGTIVLSSELVFAPVFAIIFFKEFPSEIEIMGGVFIASAILVSNLHFVEN